jgi:hypothetical protein
MYRHNCDVCSSFIFCSHFYITAQQAHCGTFRFTRKKKSHVPIYFGKSYVRPELFVFPFGHISAMASYVCHKLQLRKSKYEWPNMTEVRATQNKKNARFYRQ